MIMSLIFYGVLFFIYPRPQNSPVSVAAASYTTLRLPPPISKQNYGTIPSQVKASQLNSTQVESNQANSDQMVPADTKSNQVKSHQMMFSTLIQTKSNLIRWCSRHEIKPSPISSDNALDMKSSDVKIKSNQMMLSIAADGSLLRSAHFLAFRAVGPRISAAAAA